MILGKEGEVWGAKPPPKMGAKGPQFSRSISMFGHRKVRLG